VPYVRTVKTASGATAVQIVYSSHRGARDIEHIGSAHGDAELELLKTAARRGAFRADRRRIRARRRSPSVTAFPEAATRRAVRSGRLSTRWWLRRFSARSTGVLVDRWADNSIQWPLCQKD
jgi:hypothetical protein